MPSYKKDAMKLIINRIYRYIGNVFDEIQKKVMRDDIMKQRKELYELMHQQQKLKKAALTPAVNNENDVNQTNQNGGQQEKKQPNFRELFE